MQSTLDSLKAPLYGELKSGFLHLYSLVLVLWTGIRLSWPIFCPHNIFSSIGSLNSLSPVGDDGGKILIAIITGAFSGSGLVLQVTELLSGTAGTGNQVWLLQNQSSLQWHEWPVLQSQLPQNSRQCVGRVLSSQGTSLTMTLWTSLCTSIGYILPSLKLSFYVCKMEIVVPTVPSCRIVQGWKQTRALKA